MSGFCALLRALATTGGSEPATARNLTAPDAVHRAYVDLVARAFTYIRSTVGQGGTVAEEIHDLADALHNIRGILEDYGSWIDDAEYRRLYLRSFDAKWATEEFGIERFLDERISYYVNRKQA